MLKSLKVSNLAVVEKAEAEFAPGLNVITGETGAGKSVLIGAIELVMGGRADPGIVRDGAREAEVEAAFDGHTVRRTVTAEGRSRAWIDDESVTLAELKAFAEKLVDIHGPRANQQILDGAFQRTALDSFGGIDISAYAAAYADYSRVLGECAELKAATPGEDELDLLRYQVAELEEANLTDEDDTIAERHAAAAHATEIVESANAITEGLGGDRGVAELLARLQPRFAAAARHFPAAAEWASEAEELTVRVQELSRTVADAVSSVEVDPDTFEELDRRLAVVNRLKRKYGDPRAKLAEKKSRLDGFEHREERLAELEGEKAKCEARVRQEGSRLTAKRKSAGEKFSRRVTRELRDLGFASAGFSVRIEPSAPAAHGCDAVTYLFEPNPGEQARALSEIASSGEIARVMLSVKEALAGHDSTGTLIFDEIDANIGGEIGAVVGAKMKAVAKTHQVLAITHLPQSAVFGERHLVVAKRVSGGRTRTTVLPVDGESRVAEIARMLGGEDITRVVKEHAKELLAISG